MIKLLKFLLKAIGIVLIGQEAMAANIVTADRCPATSRDHISLKGKILMKKYNAKYRGDLFEMENTVWRLDGSSFDLNPQISNSTYDFFGAKVTMLPLLAPEHETLTCGYSCQDRKKCKPNFEDLSISTDKTIDPSIKKDTKLLLRNGLWKKSYPLSATGALCQDDNIPIPADSCAFKYANLN